MTAVEVQPQALAVRTYAADLTPGDGRTVDVRIVPYGERITHNDGLGGLPVGVPYEEECLPGLFDHQLEAAHRVLVNVDHEEGIAGVVGRGVALRSSMDGCHGSFRMLKTPGGDTALELVREGALTGVSFEAYFRKSLRTAAGVVQRVKADLVKVALTAVPAYSGALVMGMRVEDQGHSDVLLDEEILPVPFDAELAARIERLGIDVPSRLKTAHPDTSAREADTSAPASEND
jgi:HK97 family phage prohead protease